MTKHSTKAEATAILAQDGLTWASPVADIMDSLIFTGEFSDNLAEACARWAI